VGVVCAGHLTDYTLHNAQPEAPKIKLSRTQVSHSNYPHAAGQHTPWHTGQMPTGRDGIISTDAAPQPSIILGPLYSEH
jgi:hypothetical protein